MRQIMQVLKKLETDKIVLANRSDFTVEAAHSLFTDSTLDKLSSGNLVATYN